MRPALRKRDDVIQDRSVGVVGPGLVAVGALAADVAAPPVTGEHLAAVDRLSLRPMLLRAPAVHRIHDLGWIGLPVLDAALPGSLRVGFVPAPRALPLLLNVLPVVISTCLPGGLGVLRPVPRFALAGRERVSKSLLASNAGGASLAPGAASVWLGSVALE